MYVGIPPILILTHAIYYFNHFIVHFRNNTFLQDDTKSDQQISSLKHNPEMQKVIKVVLTNKSLYFQADRSDRPSALIYNFKGKISAFRNSSIDILDPTPIVFF